ncbi:autism susceptibility gene 2 protein-like isoform X2 [Mytilus edulis]|uniref:autism susceptibility gene 2 protein-like isoform X2 n=1 Tax=Mytilus edulis TaxID=6550 RepID=UPI0039F0032D
MENETSKKQRFTKRRERAQVNQVPDYGSGDDDPPSVKDKPRSKPRKKKNIVNLSEEDVIDGFAILSFKSFEDLENCIKASTKQNEKTETNVLTDKHKSSIKKKVKKHRPLPLPSPRLRQSEESVEPSSSGELTDHHKVNSPRRSTDSRDLLSEASSSSGRGYLCDSESGDDRASDASSDIFSISHNRECVLPLTKSTCSSSFSTTVTTSSTSNLTITSTNTLASTTTTSPTTTTCALSTSSVITESTKTTCSITSPAVTATTSVITNGPSVTAPSLKRKTLSPLNRVSPITAKAAVVPRASSASSTPLPLSASKQSPFPKDQRKVSPSPRVTPKREDFREKEHHSNSFPKPWPGSNTPGHLFGPQVSLSPGPYNHSGYSQQPNHNPGLSHSMFASPLPPGPSSNLGAGAAQLSSPTDSMNVAGQEILREELNRRFLLSQERPTSSLIGPPPYMKADIHQHQHMHQHQHQHTHQHMYPIIPPFTTGAMIPNPAPLPVNKFGDNPLYRNFGMPPGYSGLSPLMPPSGGLSSTLTGAFQPKRVSTGLHPSQMLHSLRDRDKIPSAATLPAQKKPGKWNAVHVRIAWEIYQHQQKHIELQKGQEGKSMEPLRPPSHLFPGASLHRPTDLSASTGLLSQGLCFSGSHGRNSLEQPPGHSGFLNPMHSGASPFPKPSPYSMSNPLGFGGLGSSGAFSGRGEMPNVPGLTSPHEWNRLHRTPPTFPGAQTGPWSKREDGEIDRGDRGPEAGVLALDRRREEDRERERRNGEHDRRVSLEERSRERELSYMKDAHASRSRSRSRSPLQNGRVGSAKSDSSYERRFDDKSGLKIKQERREEDLILHAERDKLRTDYLLGRSQAVNPMNFSMLDRARLLGAPSPYMFGDRVPPHPALLSQYDKSPLEMNLGQHQFQLQRDMERERERMLSRIQHPSLFDPEQLRKEELFLQDERVRRDILERLPFYDPQRMAFEQSRYPHLRPPDPLSAHFPRTISPMIAHAKGGSPAGYPPPLIPSSSATQSRTQSPGRSKPSATETSDKRDNYSNDPGVHSR